VSALDNVDVKAATQGRREGRQRPDVQHRLRCRAGGGADARRCPSHQPGARRAQGGEWKRSKYTGIELYEKTVGIVGLGRIGVLVAQRLSAFGMKVIAYDPYVQAGRAAQMGVRLVDLDTLLAEADFMSVHLPKTPRLSA
jgi:D-3-phosphoglycerate dehydrogenase